jgi:parvulin-like peptidyl-prolyl isomerase
MYCLNHLIAIPSQNARHYLANIAITLLLSVSLAACSNVDDAESTVEMFDFDLTQNQLAHQLKATYGDELNAREIRSNRQILSFIERNAMAEAIAQKPDFDRVAITSELMGLRNELILKEHIASIEKAAGDEAKVKAFYENNKDKFVHRKVKAGQIYFRATRGTKTEKNDAARETAESVLEKLKNGAEFAEMARQYSDDKSSAENGGDIGWIDSDTTRNSILEAALRLGESEVSSVIETNRGFYIFKALEGPVETPIAFDNVKEKLAYDMKYQSKVEAMNALKKQAATRIAKDYQRFNIQK